VVEIAKVFNVKKSSMVDATVKTSLYDSFFEGNNMGIPYCPRCCIEHDFARRSEMWASTGTEELALFHGIL